MLMPAQKIFRCNYTSSYVQTVNFCNTSTTLLNYPLSFICQCVFLRIENTMQIWKHENTHHRAGSINHSDATADASSLPILKAAHLITFSKSK